MLLLGQQARRVIFYTPTHEWLEPLNSTEGNKRIRTKESRTARDAHDAHTKVRAPVTQGGIQAVAKTPIVWMRFLWRSASVPARDIEE